MKEYRNSLVFSIFNYTLFVCLSIIMTYPLWYVLMYSLSSNVGITVSGTFILPQGFTFDAYRYILANESVLDGYRTSILVTFGGTCISMILTTLTAFPLCRKDLPGRRIFMGLIIFTMIFHGGMIPTYIIIRTYGLINTLWALMLPTSISVYNLIIMMRFFKQIPDSLLEAAYIDGHNDISIFLMVILPLSKPILATITLFYAVTYWNAFLPGILYINSRSLQPIQVVLYNMVKVKIDDVDALMALMREPMKMAVAVMAIVPILVLYPFLQRYFISGVMIGSVKE
jgi:putative aldouronate transport system permease protein